MLINETDDRPFSRVLEAVAVLKDVDAKLSQCNTIDEISDRLLIHCNAIQTYAINHNDLGEKIVKLAKDCAEKCQNRITELQYAKNAKKVATLLISSNVSGDKARQSDARLVFSLPPAELDEQTKTSGSVQLIARKVRKARGKRELKSTPAQLEGARRRRIRAKQKQREANPPPPPAPKLSPAQKFSRYWTQEEKLLRQFFSASDLPAIEKYWTREFQVYRTEVETGTRERNEALAKLKKTTAHGTDPGVE